jgi:hypothetical protein
MRYKKHLAKLPDSVFLDSLDADESTGFLFVFFVPFVPFVPFVYEGATDPLFSSASRLLNMQVRIGVIAVHGILQLLPNRLGDRGFQILSNQRGSCVSDTFRMQLQHRGGADFQISRHPGTVAVRVDTPDNTADQVGIRYQTAAAAAAAAPFSQSRVKKDVGDELRIFGTDGNAVCAQALQLVVAARSEVEIADGVFGCCRHGARAAAAAAAFVMHVTNYM